MVVELRKRKAPAEPAPAPEKKSRTRSGEQKAKTNNGDGNHNKVAAPQVGDTIALEGFGGEIETHEGTKTSLKALVDESKSGVVLFTYPKASTPGCTKQACLFRDGYEQLTSTGLSIYGLSTDSPKANTTFKTKQNLPYPLLCDPKASLIGSIGLKKSPKGTIRGVFVVDKEGKVLVSEPGSPASTVEAVEKLVKGGKEGGEEKTEGQDKEADGERIEKEEEKKEGEKEQGGEGDKEAGKENGEQSGEQTGEQDGEKKESE